MNAPSKARAAIAAGVLLALLLAPVTGRAAGGVAPIAIAVLEARITGVACTIVGPDGTMTVPCDNAAWSPELRPGWRAEMTATIDYHYRDDGLALGWRDAANPRPPIGFTLGDAGSAIIPDYESGAIYTLAPTCPWFSCGPAGDYGGHHGAYPPVFLSNNTFAEDVRGALTVTSTATANASYFGWTPTLYVGISQLQVNSVAAAVPEPGTWALMLGPLLVMGFVARRRTAVACR